MTKPITDRPFKRSNVRCLSDDQVRQLRACRQPNGKFSGVCQLARSWEVTLSVAQGAATGLTYRNVPDVAPPPVVVTGPDPRVLECRAARERKRERDQARHTELMELARQRFAVAMDEHKRRGMSA